MVCKIINNAFVCSKGSLTIEDKKKLEKIINSFKNKNKVNNMTKIYERWTNELTVENWTDPDQNPTGGTVKGIGLTIEWQNGPIDFDFENNTYLKGANGALIADVILSAIQRLKFFNNGKFVCRENSCAITHLEEALMWLQRRHDDRVTRKVQGKHEK